MSFETFIAGRYLKAKRKEGFISLITLLSIAGVTLGVMALVIVIAVMSGAETEFRNRILGVEPHILLMDASGNYQDMDGLEKRIRNIDGVTAVSAMVFTQAMIKTAVGLSGAVIRGIDPHGQVSLIKGYTREQMEERLVAGAPGGALPGIVLGRELAKNVGVSPGDTLVLMSPGGMISPMGYMPSLKRFSVTGVFDSGMYEYDSSLAWVHIDEARKLLGTKSRISAMGVWVKDIFSASHVKDVLVKDLGYPYYAKDWMEMNQSLFSALKLEKTAMFIILTLIILVAAFNITSALIMMVMEKTRDIAILKAMGATPAMIRKIFIFQGMIVGMTGTFLGTLSGVVICVVLKKYHFITLPAAYPFSTLPIQLEYLDVFMIAAASMALCFLSTLYPCRRAGVMDPVEALRYG
ncbi:lipoprotein-releasing ABC transporter permease subunit [Desulfocicer niacini]